MVSRVLGFYSARIVDSHIRAKLDTFSTSKYEVEQVSRITLCCSLLLYLCRRSTVSAYLRPVVFLKKEHRKP